MAAAEYQPALVEVMQEKEQELNRIIKEEQANKAQISVLSQMQLQTMERVEKQEQELRQLSAILEWMPREIHLPSAQADVEATSDRELPSVQHMNTSCSPLPQSPTLRIQSLHEEMFDILPGTVNTIRGATSRPRQMPSIVAGNPTENSFEETLTQADHKIQGMSITDPKWVRFTDGGARGMTSMPKRPGAHGSKILRTSPKSQVGKTWNWVGNTTWPTRKA